MASVPTFLSAFTLFLFIGFAFSSECPKPELLKPCECNSKEMTCAGPDDLDLKHIFNKLSLTLNEGQKNFAKFSFLNRVIPELQENTFGNITFDVIYLDHVLNLTRIETKTFSNMESKITDFVVNKGSLENFIPKYDIFAALSSMNNLKNIDIEYTNIKEIPDNAFQPLNGVQKDLKKVQFPSNQISRIGENAFQNLPNVEFIDLSSNKLQNISQNGFKFNNTSDKVITIDLTSNELNSNSFEIKSFENLKRPALLTLNYNNITYLDEKVFKNFLNNNINNRIVLSTLDCSDCRSVWLVKSNKYENQLKNLLCSDDNSIFKTTNFNKC